MAKPELSLQERASAGFSIANALDKASEFDAAFQMYEAANEIYRSAAKASGTEFNLAGNLKYLTSDWARTTFTPGPTSPLWEGGWETHPKLPSLHCRNAALRHVARGADRGASHPRVFGAGERMDIAALLKRMSRGPGNVPLRQSMGYRPGACQEAERAYPGAPQRRLAAMSLR